MPKTSRLAYIDWMRGLACVVMFQTHCYDAWLGPEARKSTFFMYSQLGGTLPAPLFLFLAGVSLALVTDKLIAKDTSRNEIFRATFRRGAEIFGLGLLFRLQEYVIALGWAPWTDLLRVDILNTIGASMMLMAILCWGILRLVQATRGRLIVIPAITACIISLLTPLLWTTWRPDWLPWPLRSYIDGAHNLGAPQAFLFPLFPWSAFAFAGLAVGFLFNSQFVKKREGTSFVLAGFAGCLLMVLSRWLDHSSFHLYSVYDYWHTSPNFWTFRVGLLLIIMCGVYAWCQWGMATNGFSPFVQLGQTSLLVYWVHLELVYGKFSILPKRVQSIRGASFGLAAIFVLMLLLSLARTRLNWSAMFSRNAKPAAAPIS